MPDKNKLLFIINPIAGTRSKLDIPALIKSNIDPLKADYEIVYSEYGGHSHELALVASRKDYTCLVAVGGDGTINEVAGALVNTNVALGIIPLGSGNGLARHMKIPLNTIEAICKFNSINTTLIDSCQLNDRYFFCTAGVGFDAHIGNVFARRGTRGFKSYIKTTLNEFFSYRPFTYDLTINGKTLTRKAFLITFANAAQYGNNAYISPYADIQDGKMDICILHPFPKLLAFSMGMKLFNKTINKSKFMEIVQSNEVIVECKKSCPVHMDGEPFELSGKLYIRLVPQSLKVVI